MNYSLQYIRIEFKRAVHAFVSGMVTLIIISVITAGSAAALYTLLQSLGISEPVKIAMCVPENAMPTMMIRFLQNVDSIKAVCVFEMTDEESAREGVISGEYGAAVILPENFYDDVNVGINTPAKIIVPSQMEDDAKKFAELLESAVSMIDTVEGGIYAATDGYREYGMIVSRTDMENYLTQIAYDVILSRTKIFDESFEDSIDVKGLVSYMVVGSCLLINMILCMGFVYLYNANSRQVVRLLRRNGLNPVVTGIVRFLIMFIQLIFVTLICALIIRGISAVLISGEDDALIRTGKSLADSYLILMNPAAVIPVLFSICAFTHLVYSLFSGREDSGLILLIIFLFMMIVGGCIVPAVFLPDKITLLGTYLPASFWRQDFFNGNALREVLLGTGFIIGGEVFSWAYSR